MTQNLIITTFTPAPFTGRGRLISLVLLILLSCLYNAVNVASHPDDLRSVGNDSFSYRFGSDESPAMPDNFIFKTPITKPWSERYILHAPAILRACRKVLECEDNASYPHCTGKEDEFYSNLIVFIPEDGVIIEKNKSIEVIQATILSSIMSGTFKKNSKVVFITAQPMHDLDGHVLNQVPVRVFTVEDVCYSLAKTGDDNIVEYVMNRMPERDIDVKLEDDLNMNELPMTLLWTWYMLIGSNYHETYTANGGEVTLSAISKLRNYYSHSSCPSTKDKCDYPTISFHPLEIASSISITDPTVLIIFGDNDTYSRFISQGYLNPETSLVRGSNSKDGSNIVNMNLDGSNGFIPTMDKLGYNSKVFPFICPSISLSDCQRNRTYRQKHNFKNLQILLDKYREPEIGMIPDSQLYIYGIESTIICNRFRSSTLEDYCKKDYSSPFNKSECVESKRCRVKYHTCYNPQNWWGCRSTGNANSVMSSILATYPPAKIILMEMITQEPVPVPINKKTDSSLVPLCYIMGCPDLLVSNETDLDELSNETDKAVNKSCKTLITSDKLSKYPKLQCSAFSHIFSNLFENYHKPGDHNVPLSCANSVLSLYVNDDTTSAFYYNKMAKHYNILILEHLTDECRTTNLARMSPESYYDVNRAHTCVLWTKGYTYDIDNDRILCENCGHLISKYDTQGLKMFTDNANGLYSWHSQVRCDTSNSEPPNASSNCVFYHNVFEFTMSDRGDLSILSAVDKEQNKLPIS